jgi:hypothetical protein
MRCLCLCPVQNFELPTDFHETFHECYAAGGGPQLPIINKTLSPTHELGRWRQHYRHLKQGPEMICSERSLKKMQLVTLYFFCRMENDNMAAVLKFSFSFQFDNDT